MPGELLHIAAGCSMYLIGRYFYKDYFGGKEKSKERFFLASTCLFFSIIPDFVLIFYYTTYYFSFDSMWPIHSLIHFLFFIFAFFALVILIFRPTKYKPIWIMGMLAVLLHIAMDIAIPDNTIWI